MICHQPRRTGAEPGSAAQPGWALSSLPSLRPRSSQEGSKSFSCSQINTFKGFLLGLGGHCWGCLRKDGPRTTQQRNGLDLSPFPGIFPFPAAFPQSPVLQDAFPVPGEEREERREERSLIPLTTPGILGASCWANLCSPFPRFPAWEAIFFLQQDKTSGFWAGSHRGRKEATQIPNPPLLSCSLLHSFGKVKK